MKVLLLDVNCKSGSTGKIVYDLYTQLNTNRHIAAVGYGRGSLIDEPNIIKFSNNIEVYAHALLTRITGLTGCFSHFATKRIITFMDEFQPDVVHLNDMHGYFVNILPVIKYLKKNNIKTVWTFHCEFMYTGKCGHSYECEKWKTECGNCPNLKDYPASLFFDFTKRMFKEKKKIFKDFDNLTIVTPSMWLANRAKQSFLGNKRIIVIPNGIDIENIFHPRNFEYLKKKHNITDEKVVLAVAPDIMCESKGGRHVLELAKRMKNENVKLILVGVKNLDEKFDNNIIALGRTENQLELAEYYSMADVFVICSKRENFPTTCIEALSCGTPVVGFDTGGTKETAPEGYGKFVKYGDIETLSNEVRLIFKGESDLLSKNEYIKYSEEKYSRLSMYNKYLYLYQK